MFAFLFIMMWIFILLTVGALVSDYVFPHIKALNRFIDSLPMMWK